jgi:hypothetical protein
MRRGTLLVDLRCKACSDFKETKNFENLAKQFGVYFRYVGLDALAFYNSNELGKNGGNITDSEVNHVLKIIKSFIQYKHFNNKTFVMKKVMK